MALDSVATDQCVSLSIHIGFSWAPGSFACPVTPVCGVDGPVRFRSAAGAIGRGVNHVRPRLKDWRRWHSAAGNRPVAPDLLP